MSPATWRTQYERRRGSRVVPSDRVSPMSGLDFLPADQRRLFIGGEWTDAEGGGTFDVIDPADGSVLCQVAAGSVGDGERALEAAGSAQAEWARSKPRDRGEILRRAFELVAERSD